jgi:hypothetical protein
MRAGRALDAMVAKYLMFDVLTLDGVWSGFWHTPGLDEHVSVEDGGSYHYSTKIESAWRVVEKSLVDVQEGKTTWGFHSLTEGWEASFFVTGQCSLIRACGETPAEAICLAALKAVGICVDQEGNDEPHS